MLVKWERKNVNNMCKIKIREPKCVIHSNQAAKTKTQVLTLPKAGSKLGIRIHKQAGEKEQVHQNKQ